MRSLTALAVLVMLVAASATRLRDHRSELEVDTSSEQQLSARLATVMEARALIRQIVDKVQNANSVSGSSQSSEAGKPPIDPALLPGASANVESLGSSLNLPQSSSQSAVSMAPLPPSALKAPKLKRKRSIVSKRLKGAMKTPSYFGHDDLVKALEELDQTLVQAEAGINADIKSRDLKTDLQEAVKLEEKKSESSQPATENSGKSENSQLSSYALAAGLKRKVAAPQAEDKDEDEKDDIASAEWADVLGSAEEKAAKALDSSDADDSPAVSVKAAASKPAPAAAQIAVDADGFETTIDQSTLSFNTVGTPAAVAPAVAAPASEAADDEAVIYADGLEIPVGPAKAAPPSAAIIDADGLEIPVEQLPGLKVVQGNELPALRAAAIRLYADVAPASDPAATSNLPAANTTTDVPPPTTAAPVPAPAPAPAPTPTPAPAPAPVPEIPATPTVDPVPTNATVAPTPDAPPAPPAPANPLDNLKLLDNRADFANKGISVLQYNKVVSDPSKGINMFTQAPLGAPPCPCAGQTGCACSPPSTKKVQVIRSGKYSDSPACGAPGSVNCQNPKLDNNRNLGPLPDNHLFAHVRVAHPISTAPSSLIVPGLLMQPVYDAPKSHVSSESSKKSESSSRSESSSHKSESTKLITATSSSTPSSASVHPKPEPKINLDNYDKEVFDMLQRLHKLTSTI